MTMAYIVVVNPQILAQTGMPPEGVVFATCISAAVATLVIMGISSDPAVRAACFVIVLTLVLMARRINGATLLGILGPTLFGIVRGIASWPWGLVAMPRPSSTLLKLDFRGAMHLGLLEIIFAFLFVDLFDNVGTLVGVCEQAGFIKNGKIPRVGRVLLADGVGTMFGALTGTSTVTSYIESAAGIAAGARTGLSNVFVA